MSVGDEGEIHPPSSGALPPLIQLQHENVQLVQRQFLLSSLLYQRCPLVSLMAEPPWSLAWFTGLAQVELVLLASGCLSLRAAC